MSQPCPWRLTPNTNDEQSVTQDDIHSADNTTINGIDAWADRGIAGRGVLVDYWDWSQRQGAQYDATQAHPIKLEHVKTILKEEKVELRPGDVLFIRTGESH